MLEKVQLLTNFQEKINDKISIIDSPGMLWPKFEDTKIGNNLAAVRKYKR